MSITLIHGGEDYYSTIQLLCNQLIPSNCIKHKFLVDRYFNLDNISSISSCDSLFGESNYIELNFKTKPTSEQQKTLIALLPQITKNNSITIICDKLSKTDLKAKWVSELIKYGTTIAMDSNIVLQQLQHIFKDSQQTISSNALSLLESLNSGNNNQLIQSAIALSHYQAINDHIDVNEVTNFISDSSNYSIYQLSEAYLSGNLELANKILANLYQNTEDAILIAWIIGEDLKKLLKIKGLLKQKISYSQIANELKIFPKQFSLYQNAEKNITYNSLINNYSQLAILDCAIKGIVNKDVSFLLTQLINSIATTQ